MTKPTKPQESPIAKAATIGAMPGAVIVATDTGDLITITPELARRLGPQLVRMAFLASPQQQPIACDNWPVAATGGG
jgi:hypothetical protein